MGQLKTYFSIVALLCMVQQPVLADQKPYKITPVAESQPMVSPVAEDTTSITRDILPEFIIRPAWFVGSVFGAAIFVAGSPFSGLASIPEPHDAFKITFNDFVKTPFNFTFRRPIGEWGKY